MTQKDEIEKNRRTAWKALGLAGLTAAGGSTIGTLAWLDARNNPRPETEDREDDDIVYEEEPDLTGLYRWEDVEGCLDYSEMSADRGELEAFASDYDNLGILLEPKQSDRYHGTFYQVSEASGELVKEEKLPYGKDNIVLEEGCLEDL